MDIKNKIEEILLTEYQYIDCYTVDKLLDLVAVMPSGFTLKQENAIWAIIQYLAKEQFKNPRRVYKRKDVFDLIKAEMDW